MKYLTFALVVAIAGPALADNEAQWVFRTLDDIPADIEKQEREELLQRSPKFRNLAFGVVICSLKNNRSAAFAEIAAQKKYARIGGFVDYHKMQQMQNWIRFVDEKMIGVRQNMASFGTGSDRVVPMKCSVEPIQTAFECRATRNAEDICDKPWVKVLNSFVLSPTDDNNDE